MAFALNEGKTLSSGEVLGPVTPIPDDVNLEVVNRAYLIGVRHPTFSLFVENIGDLTEDVIQIDVTTEAEDSLREPSYGRGVITLDNTNGKYTNAEIPIIEEDAVVWVYAGFNDENARIWTGVVTDANSVGGTGTISLKVAQMGERLRQASTSGDLSDFNTPKLLIEYLAEQGNLAPPVIDNPTFAPTTTVFGNTDIVGNRTFWAFIHGACLTIACVPYFDEFGVLNVVHRSTVNDIEIILDDNVVLDVQYIEDGVLINERIVDYGTGVKWGDPLLGDLIHPGQTTVTRSNEYSKNRWGTKSNFETDPLIGTFDLAKSIALEDLDWFPFRRSKYRIRNVGIPQIKVFDRLLVGSTEFNVAGRFTVIGRTHHIARGSYTTDEIVISHGERL